MKKYFVVSLCRNGLLGGGMFARKKFVELLKQSGISEEELK